MPNHVTHRVVVTGTSDAIARFKAAFFFEKTERDFDGTEHRYTQFDFNMLVPMPELLRQTESSSSLTHGLLVLGRTDIVNDFGISSSLHDEVARFLSYDWVKEAGVTDYALYMIDPNGIVATCNAGAQRIKGYAAGEIIGVTGSAVDITRQREREEREGDGQAQVHQGGEEVAQAQEVGDPEDHRRRRVDLLQAQALVTST